MKRKRLKAGHSGVVWLVLASVALTLPVSGQTVAKVRPRLANAAPENAPAEVVLTLNEAFFKIVLETVLREFAPPSYPLKLAKADREITPAPHAADAAHAPDPCPSAVTLAREAANVRTAIYVRESGLNAPLAFTGSYKPPFGCLRFQGWADTDMTLDFNAAQQTLNLRVTVKSIHLNNVPSLFGGPLKDMVQESLDKKINPLPLLKAEQISAQLPLNALGGTLQMRAREVRPVFTQGALQLHIFYDLARA